MKTRIFTAIALGLVITLIARAQVPGIINYQGRIVDNGTNFNGTGLFEFALVNPGGTTNFWSNNGTPIGQPSAAVSLIVTKGLYSALLGDTTISNMTAAVPATVFTNSSVWLRVWFNDGATGFQQLSPDQRIAAIGYALMAANVPDGTITSNKLAVGAVGPSALAVGVMTASDISNNFVSASQGLSISNLASSVVNTNYVNSTVAGATFSNKPKPYIVNLVSGLTNFFADNFTCLSNVTYNTHVYLGPGVQTYTKTGVWPASTNGVMFNWAGLTNVVVDVPYPTRLIFDNTASGDTNDAGSDGVSANFFYMVGCSDVAIRGIGYPGTLQLEAKRHAVLSETNFNFDWFSTTGATNVQVSGVWAQYDEYTTNYLPSHADCFWINVGPPNSSMVSFQNITVGFLFPPAQYNTASGRFSPIISHGNNGDFSMVNWTIYGAENAGYDYTAGAREPSVSGLRMRYVGGLIAASISSPFASELTNVTYYFNSQENLSYVLPGTDPSLVGYDQYSNLDGRTYNGSASANFSAITAADGLVAIGNVTFGVAASGTNAVLIYNVGGTNYFTNLGAPTSHNP